MSGTLGTHTIGGFQISGQVADGSLTTATASPLNAPATSATIAGSIVQLDVSQTLSAVSTSRVRDGSIVTLSFSPLTTIDNVGILGTFQLGSSYVSGKVGAKATRETLSASVSVSDPSTSAIGSASISTADFQEILSESISRSNGGIVVSLDGQPLMTIDNVGKIGTFQLGSSYISGKVAAEAELMSASVTATESSSLSRGIVSEEINVKTTLVMTNEALGFGRDFGSQFGGTVGGLIATPFTRASVSEDGGFRLTQRMTASGRTPNPFTNVGGRTDVGHQSLGGFNLGEIDGRDTSPTTLFDLSTMLIGDPFTLTGSTGSLSTQLGSFQLGIDSENQSGSTRETAELETSLLTAATVDPDTTTTGEVSSLTSMALSRLLSDSISRGITRDVSPELGTFTLGSTALSEETETTVGLSTETFLADSTSRGIAGETSLLSGSTFLAPSTSQALADADDMLLTTETLGAIRFISDWALDQRILGDTIDEVRNWNLIEITLRVERETVVKDVRPLTPGVGAVDVISTSDGGYEVVKRGGSNEVTLKAATERRDVRPVETWYLQNISEEVIGSEGQQYEITIEALPVREKAFDNSLGNLTSPFPDETRTQGFWKYEFEKGSIVTRRVTTDIEREPTNELKSVTVSFLAEPEEVRVMEENLSKLNAVAERDVPDGTNIVEDSTSDKRHIVDVTPPQDARDTVEAGEYYVTEWETEYQQSRAYIVQMNLVENEN